MCATFRREPVGSGSSWQRGSAYSDAFWSLAAGQDVVEIRRRLVPTRQQGCNTFSHCSARGTHSPYTGVVVVVVVVKLKVRVVHRIPITELRSVTCHMGSHRVTCHPTQVNAPHFNPSQTDGGLAKNFPFFVGFKALAPI